MPTSCRSSFSFLSVIIRLKTRGLLLQLSKAFNGTFIITVVNAYSIFIFTVVSLLLQLIYIIALSLIISALPTNCGFCLVCKAVLKHMSHLCSRTCLGGQQGILGNLIVLS